MPDTLPAVTEPQTAAKAVRKPPRSPRADRVADVLKTIVWVIPLTILLWFYAERAQSTDVKVTIPFDVRIASPDKRVTITNPIDGKIVATLSGSRTSIDRVTALIASNNGKAIVTHTIDASTPRGPIQIPIAVIADDDFFKTNGISVKEPAPASIQVYVDDVITQTLAVHAPTGIENLEGGVLFSPPTVSVTAPRSVFEEAVRSLNPPDGKPYLLADLSKLGGVLKEPGTHENQPGVSIGFGAYNPQGVKFDRQSVSAYFVVKKKLTPYTAQRIPVWSTAPSNFNKANDVDFEPKFLPDLTFEGPPEQIEILRKAIEEPTGDPFTGLVKLTEAADKVLPVKFLMPKGAEGVHLLGPEPTVDVHVVARRG